MPPIVRDVEKIYKSDPKLKRQDVQILQEWLKKQPHLPELTELFLILFLHSCYYSIEQAKATADIFFTRRTHYKHIFEHLKEDELRSVSSFTLMNVLPKKTPQGYSILFGKIIDTKAENFHFHKIVRLIDMVSMLSLYEDGPVNGAVVVFDATGFSFGHLTKFNVVTLKHALDHLQEGAPVRIKGIHLINAIPILDKALALVKPFLKSELFNLINVHVNFDTFYKYVPKECLPEDYGGEVPSCQKLQEDNLQVLLNNYKFFDWCDSLEVKESERKEGSSSFGLEGTFRKLELD